MKLGWIGYGAFGRLACSHLGPHFDLVIHDAQPGRTASASLEDVAACNRIVIAAPVQAIGEVATALAPLVQPGTRIYDVGSVKLRPMQAMRDALPDYCEIVGTHPLFGPQSAVTGLEGLPIVLCPSYGEDVSCERDFLAERLKLDVHVSDADTHDRTMARVQGLTHLVAKVITEIDATPAAYTTRSYDLLMEAAGLVAQDSDALFRAIEKHNPYSAELRERFFESVEALSKRLED